MDRIYRLINQKESISLEYKEARTSLPGNLFETICAMLNRNGGDILLGVNDDGVPLSVDETAIPSMVTNLVNLSNSQQKLDPPFILHPQVHNMEGKKIMRSLCYFSAEGRRDKKVRSSAPDKPSFFDREVG